MVENNVRYQQTLHIYHHITPLAINQLGGKYTDTHASITTCEQKQFQETRHEPGLKTYNKINFGHIN